MRGSASVLLLLLAVEVPSESGRLSVSTAMADAAGLLLLLLL